MSDLARLADLAKLEYEGRLTPVQSMALAELRQRAETANQQAAKVMEPALTAGSAMIAEPVSGFVGLAGLPYGSDVAADAVRRTQEALTYQPKTQGGMEGLQGLAGVMQPIGDLMNAPSEYLGDKAYELTGSPAVATAAYTAPQAAIELLGLKGAGKIPGRQFEIDDIGGQSFGQRGAVSGIVDVYHGTDDADFDSFDWIILEVTTVLMVSLLYIRPHH